MFSYQSSRFAILRGVFTFQVVGHVSYAGHSKDSSEIKVQVDYF